MEGVDDAYWYTGVVRFSLRFPEPVEVGSSG